MTKCVIDTNVPIVANGRPSPADARQPSVDCRIATVTFLERILKSGIILVDLAGEIQAEYRKHLSPRGQPGVGDRFYQEILRSSPQLVERMDLPKGADNEYIDLPQALVDANFDRSDRKFAALGKREQAPVFNATDSDWLIHRATLEASGIQVQFLCGCDDSNWFAAGHASRNPVLKA